ncbi:hypothetical protein ACIF80_16220 [Streptomyces sp. NPDC085927]|uniref:hypothetical protein n=1 Tax=Streptomyces sp. NPDC085927 TaxID=3365738 RepID=UPI0037D40469
MPAHVGRTGSVDTCGALPTTPGSASPVEYRSDSGPAWFVGRTARGRVPGAVAVARPVV